VRHFFDWWLVGTNDNGNWGFVTWDACNQFVAEGLSGGLAALALFIVVLRRSFGAIGRCRRTVEGYRNEWLFWSLGAALFSHVIVFLGCDYFDQTRSLWIIFIAMVSTATVSVGSMPNRASDPIGHRMVVKELRAGRPTVAWIEACGLDRRPGMFESSESDVVSESLRLRYPFGSLTSEQCFIPHLGRLLEDTGAPI
jgi:hypothetical protein